MPSRVHRTLALAAVSLFVAASGCAPRATPAGPDLDDAARRFVVLAHQLGHHDADYVDSYYGPEAWKTEADADTLAASVIAARADSLAEALGEPRPNVDDPLVTMRHRFLVAQIRALAARARFVEGERLPFDVESRTLFDVEAPHRENASFHRALTTLDSLLPGRGPLGERLETYREAFRIPPARLDTVFRAALAEARRRTLPHIALPDSESFVLEFVEDQPWGGYNWYRGNYHSLIQINVDLPSHIDRALDLACHEGYPGHHVLSVLIERDLSRGRGWQEFTLLPLYSPLALISEGTASLATEVVFSRAERAAFEKGVLFPLAGIDSSRYEDYARIQAAMDSLGGGSIEIARRFLDGAVTREEAIEWRVQHLATTRARAERAQRFAERYRSYVVNYGLGKAQVREWLAANGGTDADPERRWALFKDLISKPYLPADLRTRSGN